MPRFWVWDELNAEPEDAVLVDAFSPVAVERFQRGDHLTREGEGEAKPTAKPTLQDDGYWETCPTCNGTGEDPETGSWSFDPCYHCNGSGEVLVGGDDCEGETDV